MELPDPLPTDPNELEQLYQEYAMQDDVDEVQFQKLMDARLAAWGIDPKNMTAGQLLGAMTESINSMLTNLYAAKESAPDDGTAGQMEAIIQMAEELRDHIDDAVHDALSGDASHETAAPAK